MILALSALCVLALIPVGLRGGLLHNYLVRSCARIATESGFRAELECPLRLPDGRTDFVDLLVARGDSRLACEIETTPRYVAVNVAKAFAFGVPLLIIVPSRRVLAAVAAQVKTTIAIAPNDSIWILLLGQFRQRLVNYFPIISTANGYGGKQKTNPEAKP